MFTIFNINPYHDKRFELLPMVFFNDKKSKQIYMVIRINIKNCKH